MPEASPDLCNPLAIWELFIQFLSANSPFGTQTEVQSPSVERAPLLKEPEFRIEEVSGSNPFQLCKPNYELFARSVPGHPTLTVIKSFATRAAAEIEKQKLPRVRLAAKLRLQADDAGLRELPANQRFDWTNDPDAKNISKRFDDLVNLLSIFPTPPSVKVNMALLPPTVNSNHRPDPEDSTKSLILIDPFQTSGLFEMAVTYTHELTHAEHYQRRKFSSHELARLLSSADFVMVELEEELACFRNEVTAVEKIINASPPPVREELRENADLVIRTPAALYFSPTMSAVRGPQLDDLVHKQIKERYLLDFQDTYARANKDKVIPSAAANAWLNSQEWAAIQETRPLWQRAGAFE